MCLISTCVVVQRPTPTYIYILIYDLQHVYARRIYFSSNNALQDDDHWPIIYLQIFGYFHLVSAAAGLFFKIS